MCSFIPSIPIGMGNLWPHIRRRWWQSPFSLWSSAAWDWSTSSGYSITISKWFSILKLELVLRSEADANRLLYPQDSDFVVNKAWRNEHYEDNLRLQYAMLSHDSNILNKKGVLKVWNPNIIRGTIWIQGCHNFCFPAVEALQDLSRRRGRGEDILRHLLKVRNW